MRRSRRSGFTPTELLVVLGFSVILIGMLAHAVNKVRMAADLATCRKNPNQAGGGCVGAGETKPRTTPRPVPLDRPDMKPSPEDIESHKLPIPPPDLNGAEKTPLGERRGGK